MGRYCNIAVFDREFASAAGVPVAAVEIGITLMIAVTVVLSLQVAGVVLMVALLVAPAAAARQRPSVQFQPAVQIPGVEPVEFFLHFALLFDKGLHLVRRQFLAKAGIDPVEFGLVPQVGISSSPTSLGRGSDTVFFNRRRLALTGLCVSVGAAGKGRGERVTKTSSPSVTRSRQMPAMARKRAAE
ncbi:MAG: hypothetical protein HC894_02290 [Microcoleus sp. SM1_3_4]|nr:hypothetical protein [Microcoleus sp. SM1_3_4]